jgi:putative transposase
MAHSYVSQLLHCVFSTKERRPMITPELQSRILPYMGGIARENKMKLIHAGGVDDHVHPIAIPFQDPFDIERYSVDNGRFVKMGP